MNFAEILRELRENKGLNQYELADILGVDKTTVCHYENSMRNPRIDFIIKISKKLNISCDYLLGIKTEEKDIFKSLRESDKNVVLKLIEILGTKNINNFNDKLLES